MKKKKIKFERDAYRKSEVTPLKDAIQELLKTYRLDRKFNYTNIINSWGEVMGPTVAKRTDQIFVKDRKLYVKLNSAPLKSDLMMVRSQIIQKLHEHVGIEVLDDLIFL